MVSVALGPPEDVVDAWGVSCHLSCCPKLLLHLYLCQTCWTVACTLHVPTNCFPQLYRSDLSCVWLITISPVGLLLLSLWKAALVQLHGG